MNPKYMNTEELDKRIKNLFNKECQLLHEVLLTVQEIFRRRLHEEFGYTSVYSYLTQEVGYSEGTAYRHIQAAKLLAEVPEVGVKIQNGEISLAQMNLLQKATKIANEKVHAEISSKRKVEILEQIAGQPVFASEKLIAQMLDIPVIKSNHIKPQADESILATLSIPKEIFDKIEHAQDLVSHSLESKDLVKFLEYAADLIIKQKTSVRVFKKVKAGVVENNKIAINESRQIEKNENASQSSRHMAVANKASRRPFTSRQRKIILERDKCCQHRDPKTKKQCQSHWHLQADHNISLWAGGESTLANAQILCGVHNRKKYRDQTKLRLR